MKKTPSLLCLFHLIKKYNYNIVPSMRFKKSKSNLNLSWIINNNCKWLLSISHPELFTITVPLTRPAQPSSVPPALNFINAPFSAVLLDHCYFEHPPSLPSYSLPCCCLPRCSTVSFSVALATALLTASFRFWRNVVLRPVPERKNNSIPGINVPYFRDNFIPGINSVSERRISAIQGINLG